MKVRRRADGTELQSVTEALHQDAVKINTKGKAGGASLIPGQIPVAPTRIEDKVDVGLAKAIQSQLDPEAMKTERRQRVEELKKLVQSGQYNPPSQAVASSIAEELFLEISSAEDLPAADEV
jgi:hypothetical protein